MLTKKLATTWKWRTILFGGNVKDTNPGGQHLSSPDKTALKRQERESDYIQVCNKAGTNLNIKNYDLERKTIYQLKEFSVLLCIGRYKPLSSLNSFLSYATQLFGAKSSFLIVYILNSLFILRQIWWTAASCISWAPQLLSGGSICQIYRIAGIVFSLGSPHSHMEARNCWWLWHFLPTNMAGNSSFHISIC